MINQSSLPLLSPPVIPEDWCPTGSIVDIFNDFLQNWIAKTQVILPGFESINFSDLIQIQDDVDQLQADVDALQREERYGFNVPVSATNITTIAFSTMPTTSYVISVLLVDDGSHTTDFGFSLIPGSKTTTQFQIRTRTVPATWKIDWNIRQI